MKRKTERNTGRNFSRNFFKKLVLFTLLFSILAIFTTGLFLINYAINSMPIDYDAINLNFSSIIFANDENGNPVQYAQIHGEENRLWVDFAEIPQDLKDAFVAIEDERFYQHGGFDIPRTLKATMNFIFNRSSSYGGSTINQQLVKNLTGHKEKSVERKFTEIIRAIHMNNHLSKDQILELYMNTIYLSQGCNGVKTASTKYFGKDVSELTLAECASLAGITQYPTQFDPILNPDNNKQKQKLVLEKMLELEMITEDEYTQAINEPLNIQNNDIMGKVSQSTFTDYIMEQIVNDLQKELGVNESVATSMVYSGGLQIYSTIDDKVQNAIETVYSDPAKYLGLYNPDDPIQSAIVMINPESGAIIGMRGELGEKTEAFTLNRAASTLRQPGSSIKPLAVYAPGIEYNKFSAGTIFVDEPHTVPGGHTFTNAGDSYRGSVTVRTAIAASLNPVAVKALERLGVENSYSFMTQNLRFTSLSENDKALSPLACGGLTNGVTVLEMTAAYTSFANSGIYVKPYCYTKVTDMNGKVLLENRKDSNVAMSESTAYTMLQCLQSVVNGGTGTSANFSPLYYIGGKTGSTDDYRDRWFIGITPYYVGGVWFGYDQPRPISGYSGNPAATLWRYVMEIAHTNLPAKQFEPPKGTTEVQICMDSGMRAGELCSKDYRGSRVSTEQISITSAPTETCNIHQSVTVDKDSGMPVSPNCPASLHEVRIMPVTPETSVPCTIHSSSSYSSNSNSSSSSGSHRQSSNPSSRSGSILNLVKGKGKTSQE